MHIDVKLLKACLKNKRKAQEELYEACYMFLIPICKRYHNNIDDARAIFNEAFIKILDNLEKVDLEELNFVPWAKRITSNLLIDEYRKTKNYREKIMKTDEDRTIEYFSESTTNDAITDFNEQNIMSLLEFLNPATKHVFILYVIEGYKHREISEMLDMSIGTSKWHLSSARKELQTLLEKQNEQLKKKWVI